MTRSFTSNFLELLNAAKASKLGMARGYLSYSHANLYLRIGPRFVGGENISCLQIASITIPEKYQNKEIFTKLLSELMVLDDRPIYVECVLNKRFGDALIRRGFVVVRSDMGDVSRDLFLAR